MKPSRLLTALCLISLVGCEQPPSPTRTQTQQPVTPVHRPPTHRFENVSPTGSMGVALDTVTGQWCRTWDWDYKGSAQRFDLNTLPLCKSLYDSFPSDDSDDPFAQFGGTAITPQAEQTASHP
jgi:hypothetical protein